MTLDTLNVGLITGIAAKVFIMAADAMPPPPPGASYGWRWFYDFCQKLASNSAKVGATTLFPQVQPQPIPPADPVKQETTEPKKA
jgi:hypothetical protein